MTFYTTIRLIYSTLFFLSLPFIVLQKLIRSRKNKGYRSRWSERFGFVKFQLPQSIWIHCVSVGESIALAPLVKKLAKTHPDEHLLITTMTPTGSAQVTKLYQGYDNIHHTYIPYDIPLFLNHFIKKVNPKLCIIMETELWPNLLACCKKRHIPLILTNARLSKKSAKGYQKIIFITRHMLNCISHINAQTQADAQRFIALHADEKKVSVTGNIKYDFEIDKQVKQQAATLKQKLGTRFTWVAASTHPGEDEIILKAHQKIKQQYPNALLILVPRHPERFDTVFQSIQDHHFKVARRSKNNDEHLEDIDVYLGDTMGELMCFYAVSDIAFVGGSFSNTGGHNMLEPAALSKPILSGPSTFNFTQVAEQLQQNQALLIARNYQELAKYIIDLIQQPEKQKQMGENALRCFNTNKGALDKQLTIIEKAL
ncbi:lipid IV(A) 3-deoxy-D-manno-octulosonic acid transferase [Facilibium subflavum]|uniref:lipid IV(A) 3-deoxy-D-manno-octulosonic acid transferase n=1 Tax=Facilibium subflavum TaxID=2219058 RepID=UPI000E655DEE|nr:lipid IV(A) 3-deoxy-D-manno-octulosonic acid transferase [Facilibium subflavum]